MTKRLALADRIVSSRFGTSRGLVRLLLAHAQTLAGIAKIVLPEADAVRRLVFVCQGNICRSAFAEAAARQLGLASCSFGLSATAGTGAHTPAIDVADTLGIDLRLHRATTWQDYTPHTGDVLLAMEVRQLDRLAANPGLADLPRTLLGLWASPRRPHLHDPYLLSPAYMRTCFEAIATAVAALDRGFPNAREDRSFARSP